MGNRTSRGESAIWAITAAIGLGAWWIVLAWGHYADLDLWARLAVGAKVWHTGTVWSRDVFAFTPVLPRWVDHEWGAGLVYFAVLRLLGPAGLMLLKLALGTLAVWIPLAAARRMSASLAAIFLLALPCAWTVFPGYVPVIRSHALTYVAFALVLFLLQAAWTGRTRWLWIIPPIMLFWANSHGGFVTGFAAIACYAVVAIASRSEEGGARRAGAFAGVLVVSIAVTLLNPYGLQFWSYLAPALAHPRARVAEWGPMPVWGWDLFTGFRVLFVVVVAIAAIGALRPAGRSRRDLLPGLLLVAGTMGFAWLHRRHAPFFGIAVAAILPLFLDRILTRRETGRAPRGRPAPRPRAPRTAIVCLALYAVVAAVIAVRVLPRASMRVSAPMGQYPVAQCDILSHAGVSGNAAVPFEWGSYVAWRLYPLVKVSMDGRYEETYPETTFDMNYRFYDRKRGEDWAALVRTYDVDFVLLDLRPGRGRLAPADLTGLGYVQIWRNSLSGLWCRPKHEGALRAALASIPPTPSEPLDGRIPDRWPWSKEGR